MVGKSTWASAPTGSSEKQPSPTSTPPAMISEVAMGFLMNGAEMLTGSGSRRRMVRGAGGGADLHMGAGLQPRSEEHTSELQSLAYLVCRLLLEKKKK